MAKTRTEVIAQAHRNIRVLSADEAPSADQTAFAGAVLDSLFEELKSVQGFTVAWDLTAVPDAAFLPLSLCLSAEIQGHYNKAEVSRARAIGRLRAVLLPDDSPDRTDLDEDGTTTDDELSASNRAKFY